MVTRSPGGDALHGLLYVGTEATEGRRPVAPVHSDSNPYQVSPPKSDDAANFLDCSPISWGM
ncbi:hypothetical protein EA473_10155 [Natrarchaeobius chitinivorans]|uniref:Uncharacterized protein n=1 Tax=Natrarchaeobius chitinivorans TaxID=1679083 RepID=A0A3N6LW84_NATCH|nr:hypothetical protein EA473_10155 [Natrarchaeobius chitinivorans]